MSTSWQRALWLVIVTFGAYGCDARDPERSASPLPLSQQVIARPSPLQRAAEEAAYARTPQEKQRWLRVVDGHLRAGADYDILSAIYLNDLEQVRTILARSPGTADDFQDQSPLRTAAKLGRIDICRYLINEHRVDVDDYDRGAGFPIIRDAMGHPQIVNLLVDGGADLERRITWRDGRTGFWAIGDHATILHYAAADGEPETVGLLLDRGVDLFATAHNTSGPGQTALEVAAVFGRMRNARVMLDSPAFQNADHGLQQATLDRCLWPAAITSPPANDPGSRADFVRVLLKHGANPNAARSGVDVVQAAAREIHPTHYEDNEDLRQVISTLVEFGATMDLFSAVAVGDEKLVATLLRQNTGSGATRSYDGLPALHLAVNMDSRNIVRQLIDAGCDVDIRNESERSGGVGSTPLCSAAFWGRLEIAELLITAGADVNGRGTRSLPLRQAARMGNVQVVRLLLEKGAKVDPENIDGYRPFGWTYSEEIRTLLRTHRMKAEG